MPVQYQEARRRASQTSWKRMNQVHDRLKRVIDNIADAATRSGREPEDITLIAVSKTFGADDIEPVLRAQHRVFGENRVQESQGKWPNLKQKYPNTQLHLIGPLQTNKAKDAVQLFDCIQTLDREKLARILANEMRAANRQLEVFVQVNVGLEEQKAGIEPDAVDTFVEQCRVTHGLNVVGLMCIPPADKDPLKYFEMTANMAQRNGLSKLSMGMSGDYETAILCGATHVRVGSAIFGSRG